MKNYTEEEVKVLLQSILDDIETPKSYVGEWNTIQRYHIAIVDRFRKLEEKLKALEMEAGRK